MEIIEYSFAGILLMLTSLVLYVFLMSSVLPKWLLRIECSHGAGRDRGLRKYKYPTGRGVVYEPHPSVRKYVNLYALYTHNGYKYFKCKPDISVRRISYDIVIFDNKNRIIDVIGVEENLKSLGTMSTVALPRETSYVSFCLNSVGADSFKPRFSLYYSLKNVLIYGAAVAVVSFAQMLALGIGLERFIVLVLAVENFKMNVLHFVLPALIMGVMFTLIILRHQTGKGIKVLFNEKK